MPARSPGPSGPRVPISRSAESPAGCTRSVESSSVSTLIQAHARRADRPPPAPSFSGTVSASRTHGIVGLGRGERVRRSSARSTREHRREVLRQLLAGRRGPRRLPSRSTAMLVTTRLRGIEIASSTPLRSRIEPRCAGISTLRTRWFSPCATSWSPSLSCTPTSLSIGSSASRPSTPPTTSTRRPRVGRPAWRSGGSTWRRAVGGRSAGRRATRPSERRRPAGRRGVLAGRRGPAAAAQRGSERDGEQPVAA